MTDVNAMTAVEIVDLERQWEEAEAEVQQYDSETATHRTRYSWGKVTSIGRSQYLYVKGHADRGDANGRPGLGKWPGKPYVKDADAAMDRLFEESKEYGPGKPMFVPTVEITIEPHGETTKAPDLEMVLPDKPGAMGAAWRSVAQPSLVRLGYKGPGVAKLLNQFVLVERKPCGERPTQEKKKIQKETVSLNGTVSYNEVEEWVQKVDEHGNKVMVPNYAISFLKVSSDSAEIEAAYFEMVERNGNELPDAPQPMAVNGSGNGGNGGNGSNGGSTSNATALPWGKTQAAQTPAQPAQTAPQEDATGQLADVVLQRITQFCQTQGGDFARKFVETNPQAQQAGLTLKDSRVQKAFADAGHPLA